LRATRLLLIVSFLLLLALPGLQMRYRLVPEVSLSGVLVKADRPPLEPGGWWSGSFQERFEAWFGEQVGFRGHAVRTDNQIGLSVFREASSKAAEPLILGRRMMVYQDAYVVAYDGTSDYDDRSLRKRVRGLRRLQSGLASRGIAFVLLISPSKAAIYPEYLPRGFVHPASERPRIAYERMLPMLREAGIHVVDGRAILEEEKARSRHALFPPGGVHWNRYSCALVLRRAWQALGEQLGRPLAELRWSEIREDDTPARKDQETDGADLMNAWHVGHADWKFPRPSFFTVDGYRPRLAVVGDSFWWLALDIISENRLAAKSEFLYYFNDPDRTGDRRVEGQPRGLPRGMSWNYLLSTEAVIVEGNEAGLGDLGHGFVEAAGEALSAASEIHAAGPIPGR
jgi:alginate O-acetyltransferase complex protein AlgJ